FSALINNDKVGALFFSEKVEKFIPPKKGRSHLLHIIREVIEFRPSSDGTDIGEALRYLTNAIKKRCTAFLLSDMLDVNEDGSPRYEDALKVAVNRHDLSVIEVYDPREREIPDVGLVHIKDSETGKSAWVNTSSRKMRQDYARWWASAEETAFRMLMKYNVDSVSIATDQDYVRSLMAFFQKR
ncbi:MAG: VWA domain-containing protein, partial [Clostridium sp.]|nr:VWA domain-containing protein [Clostridium sp.]